MKRESLAITIALTVIVLIAAVCAHNTAMGNLEAGLLREIRVREAEISTLRKTTAMLQAELRPKPYTLPTEQQYISSNMGYRTDPMGGSEYERLHKGIDYAGMIGDPVYAAVAGVVAEHWVPPDGGTWEGHPALGGMITLEHDGFFIIYGHLSETYVHEGDRVERGQLIGRVGNTGVSTGPHLHFEVVVDPLYFLAQR